MARLNRKALLSLQPAIRQLKKLGQHGMAGAFHALASRIVDNPSLDDGVKETLLGQLIIVADFKSSELSAQADGPSDGQAPRPPSGSPKGPGRKRGKRA